MAKIGDKLRDFLNSQIDLSSITFVYLLQTSERRIQVYSKVEEGILAQETRPASILWKVPTKIFQAPYCAWLDLNYESYWDALENFALVEGRTKILAKN